MFLWNCFCPKISCLRFVVRKEKTTHNKPKIDNEIKYKHHCYLHCIFDNNFIACLFLAAFCTEFSHFESQRIEFD